MSRNLFTLVAILVGCLINEAAAQRLAKQNGSQTAHPRFVRATDLIGHDLEGVNRQLGSIRDLAIDLETAHAALALTTPKGLSSADTSDQSTAIVSIPLVSITSERAKKRPLITDAMMRRVRSVSTPSVPFNRHFASQQYQSFQTPAYWQSFTQERSADDPQFVFDEENFELTLFKTLGNTPITDRNGKLVGQIIDLAIDPETSRIEYAILQSDAAPSRWLAIPLPAFEKHEDEMRIELDAEKILSMPKIKKDALPQEVDRRWKEYVSVKYGNRGVQKAPGSNRSKSQGEQR